MSRKAAETPPIELALYRTVLRMIDAQLRRGAWPSGRELTLPDAVWLVAIGERIRAELYPGRRP